MSVASTCAVGSRFESRADALLLDFGELAWVGAPGFEHIDDAVVMQATRTLTALAQEADSILDALKPWNDGAISRS